MKLNNSLKYTILVFVIVGLINFFAQLIVELLAQVYQIGFYPKLILIGLGAVGASFLTTVLIVATAQIVQFYTKTIRRMLRLDTMSHPLLLRLRQEAPSTFQHAMQVANLASKGAKAIGADAFLTRVGGYYHDIGKLAQPNFFLENKRAKGIKETSEGLNLSQIKQRARKIITHVKDGIKLGREYNLPEEILAFLPEHHGTNLIQGLYETAKKINKSARKADFRYLGPKPLSKETAILMLADSVEVASRTLKYFKKKSLSKLVEQIINQRVKDKQLEYSGLTSADLRKIHQAFVEESLIIHHKRDAK